MLSQPSQRLKKRFQMVQTLRALLALSLFISFPAFAEDKGMNTSLNTDPESVSLLLPIESIQINSLPALTIDTVGTHTALPKNIWSQSDSGKIISLIDKVSQQKLSPAETKVFSSMITTDTTGMVWKSDPLSSNNRFLMTRLNALMHLGLFDQALGLIDLIPKTQQNTPDIAPLKMSAFFLSGQTKEACAVLEKMDLTEFVDKMRISCFMADGDMPKAALAFATYKETEGGDTLLLAIGDRVFQDIPSPILGNAVYAPEHIALVAALGDKMPDMTNAPIWVKKALTRFESVPIASRILWAEQSALSAAETQKLYKAVFPKTPPQSGALIRALAYQQILSTNDKALIAGALNDYLDSAREDGVFTAVVPIAEPILHTLTPDEETSIVAFNAVQIYALTNNLSLAAPWYDLLKNNPQRERQNQGILLSPLMNKMGAGLPSSIDSLLAACQKSSPNCDHFIQIVPDSFPVENTDLLMALAMQQNTTYSALNKKALDQLIMDGKTGEAMLQILLLLSHSQTYEKDILDALETIQPVSLSKPIILEQLVY